MRASFTISFVLSAFVWLTNVLANPSVEIPNLDEFKEGPQVCLSCENSGCSVSHTDNQLPQEKDPVKNFQERYQVLTSSGKYSQTQIMLEYRLAKALALRNLLMVVDQTHDQKTLPSPDFMRMERESIHALDKILEKFPGLLQMVLSEQDEILVDQQKQMQEFSLALNKWLQKDHLYWRKKSLSGGYPLSIVGEEFKADQSALAYAQIFAARDYLLRNSEVQKWLQGNKEIAQIMAKNPTELSLADKQKLSELIDTKIIAGISDRSAAPKEVKELLDQYTQVLQSAQTAEEDHLQFIQLAQNPLRKPHDSMIDPAKRDEVTTSALIYSSISDEQLTNHKETFNQFVQHKYAYRDILQFESQVMQDYVSQAPEGEDFAADEASQLALLRPYLGGQLPPYAKISVATKQGKKGLLVQYHLKENSSTELDPESFLFVSFDQELIVESSHRKVEKEVLRIEQAHSAFMASLEKAITADSLHPEKEMDAAMKRTLKIYLENLEVKAVMAQDQKNQKIFEDYLIQLRDQLPVDFTQSKISQSEALRNLQEGLDERIGANFEMVRENRRLYGRLSLELERMPPGDVYHFLEAITKVDQKILDIPLVSAKEDPSGLAPILAALKKEPRVDIQQATLWLAKNNAKYQVTDRHNRVLPAEIEKILKDKRTQIEFVQVRSTYPLQGRVESYTHRSGKKHNPSIDPVYYSQVLTSSDTGKNYSVSGVIEKKDNSTFRTVVDQKASYTIQKMEDGRVALLIHPRELSKLSDEELSKICIKENIGTSCNGFSYWRSFPGNAEFFSKAYDQDQMVSIQLSPSDNKKAIFTIRRRTPMGVTEVAQVAIPQDTKTINYLNIMDIRSEIREWYGPGKEPKKYYLSKHVGYVGLSAETYSAKDFIDPTSPPKTPEKEQLIEFHMVKNSAGETVYKTRQWDGKYGDWDFPEGFRADKTTGEQVGEMVGRSIPGKAAVGLYNFTHGALQLTFGTIGMQVTDDPDRARFNVKLEIAKGVQDSAVWSGVTKAIHYSLVDIIGMKETSESKRMDFFSPDKSMTDKLLTMLDPMNPADVKKVIDESKKAMVQKMLAQNVPPAMIMAYMSTLRSRHDLVSDPLFLEQLFKLNGFVIERVGAPIYYTARIAEALLLMKGVGSGAKALAGVSEVAGGLAMGSIIGTSAFGMGAFALDFATDPHNPHKQREAIVLGGSLLAAGGLAYGPKAVRAFQHRVFPRYLPESESIAALNRAQAQWRAQGKPTRPMDMEDLMIRVRKFASRQSRVPFRDDMHVMRDTTSEAIRSYYETTYGKSKPTVPEAPYRYEPYKGYNPTPDPMGPHFGRYYDMNSQWGLQAAVETIARAGKSSKLVSPTGEVTFTRPSLYPGGEPTKFLPTSRVRLITTSSKSASGTPVSTDLTQPTTKIAGGGRGAIPVGENLEGAAGGKVLRLAERTTSQPTIPLRLSPSEVALGPTVKSTGRLVGQSKLPPSGINTPTTIPGLSGLALGLSVLEDPAQMPSDLVLVPPYAQPITVQEAQRIRAVKVEGGDRVTAAVEKLRAIAAYEKQLEEEVASNLAPSAVKILGFTEFNNFLNFVKKTMGPTTYKIAKRMAAIMRFRENKNYVQVLQELRKVVDGCSETIGIPKAG